MAASPESPKQAQAAVTQGHGSMPGWSIFLAGSVIVLAALAVYYRSLSCPFIFDDGAAITENLTIRHLSSALSPPSNGGGAIGRPVVNLSLAVNYAVGGLGVWGYHAMNLVIHILAGLILFGLVRRTLLRPAMAGLRRASPPAPNSGTISRGSNFADSATVLAFIVALLWTVHPLQTESVTCVIQRSESLMGLFYLLTLYCFIRGVEAGKSRAESQESRGTPASGSGLSTLSSRLWFSASIISCLLGMATKEVMVSAPLIVLLYDRTFVAGTFREAWGRRRGWYLGLFGTWLVLGYLVVRMGGRRGTAAGFGLGITPWTYALTQCRAIVLYLKLVVWPHPLVLDYGMDVVRQAMAVAPQAIFLALLAAGTIFMLRYWPAVGFAGAWFFAILAPSSSVVPLPGQTMAEHRMYLPLAAVIALLVLGLYARIGPRSLMIFAAAAVGLGWLTIQRNKDYRSELAIWKDTVAKCPDNARAHNHLGYAMTQIPGRLSEAIFEYETALRINPRYVDSKAHYNLGLALANVGRISEAIFEFEETVRIEPGYAEAHYNLGTILGKIGRISEAIAQLEEAVRLDPDYAEAHNNLAIALYEAGRISEAMAQCKEALRIKPDFTDASVFLEELQKAAK
jgi:protein O-mannosyl-transferase